MTSAVEGNTPSEGRSIARIGLIGTIITATATIAVAVGGWILDDSTPGVDGAQVQESPLGAVEKVKSNESGSEVTVSGWAAHDVDDVVVLVGPKLPDGGYWVANAAVRDKHWNVVVETGPKIAQGYSVTAYFNRGIRLAVEAKPLDWPSPTPPTPPPVPADITQCAALYGQQCFTDPAWGPPSVYIPN
ncbi:hypothetical protein [Mycobacterium sp. 3519A]|uniref:hypothetical protein n=1 Tax=Mycobacterium sp. 3519A TaxID=2057184 RepID=UPI001158F63A|nr:hypothetical protein [Mycobacterium sp. 3519A]